MSRGGDHETQSKVQRQAAKAKKRRGKQARRRERRRDKEVTQRYGKRGHSSCGRKVRYVSEVVALRTAIANMRRDRDIKLWVYQCPYCSGWHLTSHPEPGTGDYFGEVDGDA